MKISDLSQISKNQVTANDLMLVSQFNGVDYTSRYVSGIDDSIKNYGKDVITDTSGNYTLQLTDANSVLLIDHPNQNDVTIPRNGTVAFPIGTEIKIIQIGAGQVHVIAAGGVTFYTPGLKDKLSVKYSTAVLVKIDVDTWSIFGDITT